MSNRHKTAAQIFADLTYISKTELKALREENERLWEALKNLVFEMEFMLRCEPKKEGGKYRQRTDEAKAALKEGGK